jgi:hypothetical protein
MLTRALHILSVTLVLLLGLGAAIFIAGETFDDPGGWKAVLLVSAWVIPLLALSLLALLWPDLATKVLVGAVIVVGAFAVVDSFTGFIDRDVWGPVDTIALFAVAVPCGLLGARRASAAGWLLLTGFAVQMLVSFGRMGEGAGEGLRSTLGGSAGALVFPLLAMGLLFLVVAESERSHRGNRPSGQATVRHAH